ncbi:MAG: serine hydrolase domain-containing protein [Parvularculaceae bacterium]
MGFRSIFLLPIAVFCAGCATQNAELMPNNEFGDLSRSIDQELRRLETDGGFAGALIVEAGGKPILERGYGLADRENGTPFTVDTVAQIGSITKQFTAIAALTLADDGLLHLYRPIRTYLPEAPEPGASLTINQLMTHTSGLAEYCGEDDFEPLSRDRLIVECLSKPLAFEPGTRSEYSNVGFSIVAAIIERVTGDSLEKVLDERIFRPNGLKRTGYHFDANDGGSYAYGYDEDVRQENISVRIDDLGDDWWVLKGNGGIQASARDMQTWAHVLRGEGSLRRQTIRAFTTPRNNSDPRSQEAYGWFVFFDNDGEVLQVSHSGSDGVFFSYFWQDPRDDFFFYLVGNNGEEISKEAVRAVRKMLFDAGDGPPGE